MLTFQEAVQLPHSGVGGCRAPGSHPEGTLGLLLRVGIWEEWRLCGTVRGQLESCLWEELPPGHLHDVLTGGCSPPCTLRDRLCDDEKQSFPLETVTSLYRHQVTRFDNHTVTPSSSTSNVRKSLLTQKPPERSRALPHDTQQVSRKSHLTPRCRRASAG